MKKISVHLLALCLFVLSSPAHSSGGITCEGEKEGKKVEINIPAGRTAVLTVLNAQASFGSRRWDTNPQNGEIEIKFGQGMIEGTQLAADFTDPAFERIILSLRADAKNEVGDDSDFLGTLVIDGKITVPVICHSDR